MITFTFDLNGNIYVNQNDTIFMLYINRDDFIDFEKINLNNIIINNTNSGIQINSNKYDKIEKKNKLQVKAIEHAIEDFDRNEEFTKLKDSEDHMQQFGDYLYNPELKYYEDNEDNKHNEDDEDSEDDICEQIVDECNEYNNYDMNNIDNIDESDNIYTKYNEDFKIKIYGELEK